MVQETWYTITVRKAIIGCLALALGTLILMPALIKILTSTSVKAEEPEISAENWGTVTAPVFGASETGAYAGAELFAGPNKFGSYFNGVLPNGRIVKPAGITIQIGMNPLGVALTPDGKFLITSNDDEREGGLVSAQNPTNTGGYTLSVIDTLTMNVVSKLSSKARFFIGLQVSGNGPYTVWASGGPDNDIKLFTVSAIGAIAPGTPASIPILPILPSTQGYVSNYTPDAAFNTTDASGNNPPAPSGFSRTGNTQITFPAGSALSPDGKFLYVACNGDNSVAVIDTTSKKVVKQVPVGYFPYGVSVSRDDNTVLVANWGITKYKFAKPAYDTKTGKLTAIGTTGQNQPDGFYVPVTSAEGKNPRTSSISVLQAPNGNGASLSLLGSVYEGHHLDELFHVGDTHPSATAIVHRGHNDYLYVTKSNSDSLGILRIRTHVGKDDDDDKDEDDDADDRSVVKLEDFDLSPVKIEHEDGHKVHGSYPNAIVASPGDQRLYIAEAGINSVAVVDVRHPAHPRLIGRLPTGWYPTALAVSNDGRDLYIANAKGIGEDINPNTKASNNAPPPSGIVSDTFVDSNFIFGNLQKVDLLTEDFDDAVLKNNFAVHDVHDTSVVPIGGRPSKKIKHVFFILHENKTFDSMLGNLGDHFGRFASLTYNHADGTPYTDRQFTGVSLNTQLLASTFATAVNYYSDAEESDAGHQFAASGTASDYTEKTLLVKSGRGLLVNKNFEPEDYPEGGYIFNNAARHHVSFKDYGAMVRIEGTDTGTSAPTALNDPPSGNVGYPQLQVDNFHITNPLVNAGDTSSPTEGLGQSYFMKLPILAVLGGKNADGEDRLDRNYPGYNFNISDQRRAKEFIKDFDRMVSSGTLPEFVYIYQPNDHTGGVQAPNAKVVGTSPLQQIGDGDTALGMIIDHIMKSKVYFDNDTGYGSAIFITYDDAQSSLDHIHPHRTPLVVVSPYARPGFIARRHYSTASVVKTEELLLGLPPNNLGDLFATDLRDLFQPQYNGITADQVKVTETAQYVPTIEGKRIWSLVSKLDTSAPDRDSRRLGALARLSIRADEVHRKAAKQRTIGSASYRSTQSALYKAALKLVSTGPIRDSDD